MKSETVDQLNIWLLIIAFVFAIYLPFELFLFSYAFLGPLQYLTEINWLNDKRYFINSKSKVYWVFIILACVIAIYPLLKYFDFDNTLFSYLSSHKDLILVLGFVFSVGLVFAKSLKHLVIGIVFGSILVVMSLLYLPKLIVALGLFLPTLIHVYVFTLLFMIYGQIKSYSKSGLVGVMLLICVPLIILFFDIIPLGYQISDFAEKTYEESGFLSLNTILAVLFTAADITDVNLMLPVIVKAQVFLAFAYTYHYLNWFSKTSIIGWKSSLNSKRMYAILALWILSVGIYIYDYTTGLTVLFFLSLLHVVLEFPLNVVAIKEIANHIIKRLPKK